MWGQGHDSLRQTPPELLGGRVSLEVKARHCSLLGSVSSVGHPNMRGVNKLE